MLLSVTPVTHSWKPIEEYIDSVNMRFLVEENGLDRNRIQDDRVHCLLYFISPTGNGLRPVDIALLKAVDHKVKKRLCVSPSLFG